MLRISRPSRSPRPALRGEGGRGPGEGPGATQRQPSGAFGALLLPAGGEGLSTRMCWMRSLSFEVILLRWPSDQSTRLLAAIGWVLLALHSAVSSGLSGIVTALRAQSGHWWAIPLYFVLYVLLDILFIPTQLLSIAAALMWGWARGGTIELFAATLGAIPPYLIARTTFREWIAEKLQKARFRGARARGLHPAAPSARRSAHPIHAAELRRRTHVRAAVALRAGDVHRADPIDIHLRLVRAGDCRRRRRAARRRAPRRGSGRGLRCADHRDATCLTVAAAEDVFKSYNFTARRRTSRFRLPGTSAGMNVRAASNRTIGAPAGMGIVMSAGLPRSSRMKRGMPPSTEIVRMFASIGMIRLKQPTRAESARAPVRAEAAAPPARSSQRQSSPSCSRSGA